MNKLKYFSVSVFFFLLAIGSGSDKGADKKEDKEDKKESTYMDSAHITQKDFFKIVSKYDSIFKTASDGNKIQFQGMVDDKNKDLKEFFKRSDIVKFQVDNWIGRVKEIQTRWNGGGLKVYCNSEAKNYAIYGGSTFYLNSTNVFDDASLDVATEISKKSDLYKKLATLKEDAIIRFSGKFVKAPSYYSVSYILSNSEYANADQEYLFKFTDVQEIVTEKDN